MLYDGGEGGREERKEGRERKCGTLSLSLSLSLSVSVGNNLE